MLIGNEWHRRIFLKKIIEHNHSVQTVQYKDGLIIGFLLLTSFVMFYLLDRYYTFIIGHMYWLSFIIISTLMVYLSIDRFCYLLVGKIHRKLNEMFRWIVLFIVFILVIFWFINRFTYVGFVMMNFIVFCVTIVIVSRMRVGSLMTCMIIFGFIFVFENVLLVIRGNVVLC